ncbi:MAG: dihydrofolate reductase family protein [Ilumatobacteraceae bacterium]
MNFRVGNSAFIPGLPAVRPGWHPAGPVRPRPALLECHHRDVRVLVPASSGSGDPVTPDELYGVARPRLDGRPWVGLCMIASLDGTTVVDGRSGGLGNPTDVAVLGALRRAADMIIVGAATVRTERYGAPRKPGQRIGVVTSTADIDPDTELFTSGAGFLILPEDGPRAPRGAGGPVETIRAGQGRVDLAAALARLGELGESPTFVQAEGGSHLNGSLLDAGCVDELNLTWSPVLAGGDGPRVTSGGHATMTRLRLAHLATDDDSYVYGRWVRS